MSIPPEDPIINLAGEAELLGALLRDNQLFDAVADHLQAEDLAEPLHQRLYARALAMVMEGLPANPVTLKPWMEGDPALQDMGGIHYLIGLTARDNLTVLPQLARHLAELAQRRAMREGLEQAARDCGDMACPRSDIIGAVDHVLADRAEDGPRQISAAAALRELVDGLDRPSHGVRCPAIPALDALHGAMEPSQLVVLAARPGMGKTAAALSYALGAAQAGHGVLIASLEMSATQLAGRMAADLCFGTDAIPYAAIRDRQLNPAQRRQLAQAYGRLAALPIDIVDAGTLTPGRLAMIARRRARRMAAKGSDEDGQQPAQRLELVIVDYLQLLRPDSGTTRPYEAVSEISRALKALARDQDVAVLALAQLSREVEKRPDRRPQLSDLRDSGQIEQDADSVIFLLRDEYYLQLAEPPATDPRHAAWQQAMEQARGGIEFILAKRRNGTTGTALGRFHGAFQAVR